MRRKGVEGGSIRAKIMGVREDFDKGKSQIDPAPIFGASTKQPSQHDQSLRRHVPPHKYTPKYTKPKGTCFLNLPDGAANKNTTAGGRGHARSFLTPVPNAVSPRF
jgi:hypothetical protein